MAIVSRRKIYALALIACGVSFALALRLGAVSNLTWNEIVQLRLPRAVLAGAVGMGLAVAGAALQALFANPLCEPYTLGISSGAALGSVIGISLGSWGLVWGLAPPAFLGALVFAGVLYFFALRPSFGNVSLLLMGVLLGFFGTSLVTVWLALSDTNGLQSVMSWLWGDFSRARIHGAVLALVLNLGLTFLIILRWRELDALLTGEEGAASLGIDVPAARRGLILLTSLVIGVCVSGAGMIGFVGLLVPHWCRRWVGSLHLALLPLAAIVGATVMIVADMVARVVARPNELPVGVVTALIGVPAFWLILFKRNLPMQEQVR